MFLFTNESCIQLRPRAHRERLACVNNLAACLPLQSLVDYTLIASIDGHNVLSYDVGSSLAIIRSSREFNDGQLHKITALCETRLESLSVDDEMRFQGEFPGKLSTLNDAGKNEIYLGGSPLVSQQKNSSSGSGSVNDNSTSILAIASSLTGGAISYLPDAFSGCISQVYLSEHGPLKLVRSDFRTQVQEARNLVACNSPARNEQQKLSSSVLAAQQLLSSASSGSSVAGAGTGSGNSNDNGSDKGNSYGGAITRRQNAEHNDDGHVRQFGQNLTSSMMMMMIRIGSERVSTQSVTRSHRWCNHFTCYSTSLSLLQWHTRTMNRRDLGNGAPTHRHIHRRRHKEEKIRALCM